jgi:uncharacterized protein (DUF433 family)
MTNRELLAAQLAVENADKMGIGQIVNLKELTMNPLLERISIDPNICFGKPCIRGTRIWVSLILDFLASGMAMNEVLAEYPHLTHEDILAALAYGAEMSRERFIMIPAEEVA